MSRHVTCPDGLHQNVNSLPRLVVSEGLLNVARALVSLQRTVLPGEGRCRLPGRRRPGGPWPGSAARPGRRLPACCRPACRRGAVTVPGGWAGGAAPAAGQPGGQPPCRDDAALRTTRGWLVTLRAYRRVWIASDADKCAIVCAHIFRFWKSLVWMAKSEVDYALHRLMAAVRRLVPA